MIAAVVGLALAALMLLLYAGTRPDHFRVTRTTVIKAPVATVFALINDLKSFSAWNSLAGRVEITASEAGRRVTMRVDIAKPAPVQHTAEFTLQPQGEQLTIVSWALQGPSGFLSRLKGLVVDLDTAIGGDLEAGLAKLRALAESRRPAR